MASRPTSTWGAMAGGQGEAVEQGQGQLEEAPIWILEDDEEEEVAAEARRSSGGASRSRRGTHDIHMTSHVHGKWEQDCKSDVVVVSKKRDAGTNATTSTIPSSISTCVISSRRRRRVEKERDWEKEIAKEKNVSEEWEWEWECWPDEVSKDEVPKDVGLQTESECWNRDGGGGVGGGADLEDEEAGGFPDIVSLFLHYNQIYFQGALDRCIVEWSSKRMTLCAGQCSFDGVLCTIRLSEPLLKYRPLSDLKNTLLHEMIHAHIFLHCPGHHHEDHGPMFCSFMQRINTSGTPDFMRPRGGYSLTVYHSFQDEVDHYRNHHWTCMQCGKVVRRAMNRPPSQSDCFSNRVRKKPKPLPAPSQGSQRNGGTWKDSRVPWGQRNGGPGSQDSGIGLLKMQESEDNGVTCRHPSCLWHMHLRVCGGSFVKTAEPVKHVSTQREAKKGPKGNSLTSSKDPQGSKQQDTKGTLTIEALLQRRSKQKGTQPVAKPFSEESLFKGHEGRASHEFLSKEHENSPFLGAFPPREQTDSKPSKSEVPFLKEEKVVQLAELPLMEQKRCDLQQGEPHLLDVPARNKSGENLRKGSKIKLGEAPQSSRRRKGTDERESNHPSAGLFEEKGSSALAHRTHERRHQQDTTLHDYFHLETIS